MFRGPRRLVVPVTVAAEVKVTLAKLRNLAPLQTPGHGAPKAAPTPPAGIHRGTLWDRLLQIR